MEPAFRNITPCLWASRKQKIQVSRNRALSCRHEISASARRHNQNYTDYLLKRRTNSRLPANRASSDLLSPMQSTLQAGRIRKYRFRLMKICISASLKNARKPKKKTVKNNKNTQKGSYYERYFKRRTGDGTKFHFAHERAQKQGLYRVRDGRYGVLSRFRAGHVVLAKFYTDIFSLSPLFIMLMFIGARVWDAINDPVMGRLCDTIKLSNGEDIVRGSYGQRVR